MLFIYLFLMTYQLDFDKSVEDMFVYDEYVATLIYDNPIERDKFKINKGENGENKFRVQIENHILSGIVYTDYDDKVTKIIPNYFPVPDGDYILIDHTVAKRCTTYQSILEAFNTMQYTCDCKYEIKQPSNTLSNILYITIGFGIGMLTGYLIFH